MKLFLSFIVVNLAISARYAHAHDKEMRRAMIACLELEGARRPLALLSESRVMKCVRNSSVVGLAEAVLISLDFLQPKPAQMKSVGNAAVCMSPAPQYPLAK